MAGVRDATPPVRVACAQLAPVFGDLEGNAERALAAIREAAGRGAGVVVLPELALSGYVFESVEEARSLCVSPAAVAAWGDHGPVVVGGFGELGAGGELFNSAAIVDGDGVRAVYRKAHLWDREPAFFTPGAEPPLVVETAAGRIGAMVCYDAFFPEWVRIAALRGAELLCVPGNWPRREHPEGEPPFQAHRARVAAEANGIAVALCDRAGSERGAAFAGASTIAGPDGALLARAAAPEPELVVADVDLAAVPADHRAGALSQRRPELYGPLAAPTAPV
jgi:predicted amidohydrolase